ncbi:MAG: FeoA family protein [Nodosilinea sp.]
MSHLPLATLQPGDSAIIIQLHTPSEGLRQRLLALGFRQGRSIEMIRRSLFWGPLHVRIGTTEVMLRRREAENIAIALPS